jgi:hypothetical protein
MEFSSVLLQKRTIDGVGYARFSFIGTDRLARHSSCVIYKVEAGEMDVVVEGVRHHLLPGQRIAIAPYTPYLKEGNATVFARDVPPFDPSTVEYLD